jgi:hypothetical protein
MTTLSVCACRRGVDVLPVGLESAQVFGALLVETASWGGARSSSAM